MGENRKVYANLPLKTWDMFRAFDSADECEGFRTGFREKALARGEWKGFVKDRAESARCIASDDPRLKEK
jgi:hypothetical protein